MKRVGLKDVRLKDRNPGEDLALIDAELELDGVKHVCHLITGDQLTVLYIRQSRYVRWL